MNAITLYHGSTYDFDAIDLQQGRPYKDFGQGFYASADIDHAKSMAERNAQARKSKLQRVGSAHSLVERWLYRYVFDFNASKEAGLAVKEFNDADRAWGRFITLNRSRAGIAHEYDIVIGPTADDYTNPTIQFYLSGGVGDVGSDAAVDELVRLLLPFKLPAQYFFATQQAVDCLALIGKDTF